MQKIIPIKSKLDTGYVETVEATSNSKDWAMVTSMASLARPAPQKNLTTITFDNTDKKTKLALVLLPEWGVYFPPYNMARLTSVARASGYPVTTFDVNILAWNALKDKLEFDPWDPSREFLWAQEDTYYNQIHPHCEPVYRDVIKQLVEFNPDVIGFTLYYTNEHCTNWMVQQLRQQLPNVKIIAGGPQAGSLNRGSDQYYDHIVQGEGEQLLLDILDSVENNKPIAEKFLVQPKTIRLDLDNLPFPDYTGFDFSLYQMPNGASSELSRGCVAKCVFCTEVHFWKYRGRMSGSVLEEIEYQHKTHGVDFFWFIDSLVNGNLKELRAFCRGVIEKQLPIRWQGYSRCDGRMDLDYYWDLKNSGCHMLNYGVESGNQRVLDAMKKNITVDEIESNLRNSAKVDLMSSLQFFVGFPNEDTQAFADTLTLIWRIRNYNIINISPGIGMQLSPGAEVTDNQSAFAIAPSDFQGAWTTEDMTNTKLHRMIRQKNFLIFLSVMPINRKIYGYDRPNLHELYTIKFDADAVNENVPHEVFDFNIIKTGKNQFVDSAVNEILALLRTLWRSLGAYEINIVNDPEKDLREWGFRLACNYTGYHNFKIDANGSWQADFKYKFTQDPEPHWNHHLWPDYNFELEWQQQGKW